MSSDTEGKEIGRFNGRIWGKLGAKKRGEIAGDGMGRIGKMR